ncbi:MAG: type II secretion system F family protein [Nocardioidaceae bacterium]
MSVVATALLAVVAAATAAAAAVPPPPTRPPAAQASAGPRRDRPPPLRAISTLSVAIGAVLLLGGVVGVVAGLLAGALCWRLAGRLEPPSVRRRREQLTDAVPHVVDLLAACLAAGLSPSGAVEQIGDAVDGPVREELLALTARLRLGVDPATVWRDLALHPQLGGLGRAVARAVETGSSVADAMTRLADDLRRTARADVETRARAVGVKAAIPLGVCLLPAFVLVGVVPLVAGSIGVLLSR